MSDFRTVLLFLVVTIAGWRWARRRSRQPDAAPPPAKPEVAACPKCRAEIEPGFLECWQCGKMFADAKEP